MSIPIRVLFAEDSDDDAQLILRELETAEYEPVFKRVETAEAFSEAITGEEWDIVIADYSMPHFSGLEAIRILRKKDPNIPLILVSGTIGEAIAVECMKSGANDYIMKDNLTRLNAAVTRELKEAMIRKERRTVGIRLQLFRSIIEQSHDMIIIIDAKTGKLLDFNIESCRKLGYSRSELLDMMILDIEPGVNGIAGWREKIKSVKKTGGMFLECVMKKKKGNIFNAEVSLQVVTHGENEYVVEIARDITQRKISEKELIESEEKYRLITENTKDLIAMTNFDKVAGFTYVSPSYEKLLGYSPDELFGVSILEFMHDEDRKEMRLLLDKHLEQTRGGDFESKEKSFSEKLEYRFLTKTGGWCYLEGIVTLAVGRLIYVSRDITERKKMQEVMIEAEKLASIGALVAEMTHEINNPLQIMTGRAQLGLMNEAIDKETSVNFNIILEEGMKTRDIVERLLKFSKPGKGKIVETDINSLIGEIVKLMERQYILNDIRIIKRCAPDLPGIKLDGKQIQEVLLNLFSNAAQSMPGGGRIIVSTSREADNIKVEVTDEGCGIPEEDLLRLFEPFFSTKETGTGLGLPVCYGIIKEHAGRLTFKSKVGEGTTATILLPLKKSSAK